jgi:hypothetical protein
MLLYVHGEGMLILHLTPNMQDRPLMPVTAFLTCSQQTSVCGDRTNPWCQGIRLTREI